MSRIDKETYAVKEVNHYKTQLAKTQIVIGFSLRKDHNHIIRLQNKEYKKTKKWNTFTVTRDGQIFQHFDPKYHSDFLGIKEADKKIISVILENMGCLFKNPSSDYINWLNEMCPKEKVISKSILGYEYWEIFSDEQIESTVMLCRYLCDEFSIPKAMIEFPYFHKDIIKYRGIAFRSNHMNDSSDTNPIFEIAKFNEMLHNEFI